MNFNRSILGCFIALFSGQMLFAADPEMRIPPSSVPSKQSLLVAATKTKKKKKKKATEKSSFLAILPFGIGQFQNDQPAKGLLFAGVQLGSLGYFAYSSVQESAFITKYNDFMANEYNSSDPTHLDYEAAGKTYISNISMYKWISLGVFGLGWAVGIYDAFSNMKTATTKKKRRVTEWEIAPDTLLAWDLQFSPTTKQPMLGLNLNF